MMADMLRKLKEDGKTDKDSMKKNGDANLPLERSEGSEAKADEAETKTPESKPAKKKKSTLRDTFERLLKRDE